ncbi:hypothetical protein AZE42_04511 [Rhizopogon vesiculosus]|uniref:F-box domain-containing protein n=1 Tax=Rhizopogon vesiculosus TaxID=180088 RepID=A0A1J8PWY3_9AGAM|nr:hypothetical protein AZE42_04511 [Rhizopogon vesiculosus]
MVKTRSASRLAGNDPSIMDLKMVAPAASGDHSDEEDSDSANRAPSCIKGARKRSRKSADDAKPSKKSKQRGRLDLMPTMNLDILFHILSFLHPMDLVNLSRTSRNFRNLLLQRSSAAAWKVARLQVDDLPDCPPDMSEPQYANLVFYPHCHDCDKVVRSILWQFRARYCLKCLFSKSNTVDNCDTLLHVPWKRFRLASYLPSVTSREQGYYKQLFHKKAYDEMLVEHSKTPQDEIAAFFDKKRKHFEEVMEHAKQCEGWSQSVASSRKCELEKLKRDCKDAIIAHITEAGYKPELDFVGISRFEREKALFKPKTLTMQGEYVVEWLEWVFISVLPAWNRMRPNLILRLDAIRVRRLDPQVYGPRRCILKGKYKKYLQKKYLQKTPPSGAVFDLMPHTADVAGFGPFRDLIMSPESTTITEASFCSAFQQLPDLVSSWRAKIDCEFMDLVRFLENHGDSGKQNGSDFVQLATSAFVMRSGNDHRLLTYPEALLWPGFFCSRGRVDWMDDSLRGVKQFGCLPWSASRSHYPITISTFEGAVAVVRASGLDPKTAYRQDMDRLDARFACGKCSSPGRKVIMKWEMAMMHSYRMHRDLQPDEIEWTPIEGDKLANVKTYEHVAKPTLKDDTIVYCALCQHHIGDEKRLLDVQTHLARIHGIPSDKIEHGKHYIANHSSISVAAVVLDSDGKVSKHEDSKVLSYCGNLILLLQRHWL